MNKGSFEKYLKYFGISLLILFLIGLVISIIGFIFKGTKNDNNKSSSKISQQISQTQLSKTQLSKTQLSQNFDNYPKTFFIDIDGTIIAHPEEGKLDKISEIDGYVEELLPSAKEFFESLKENDIVIFTTGRREKHRKLTERTLKYHNIKYKHLIMDLPWGQRYLINDTTNMFYQKAIAINLLRDKGFGDIYNYDPKA